MVSVGVMSRVEGDVFSSLSTVGMPGNGSTLVCICLSCEQKAGWYWSRLCDGVGSGVQGMPCIDDDVSPLL